jgi:type IV pilus assembly protein PilB
MKDGEKVVMRILDKQKSTLPLPALGFSEENLNKYRDCIRQPYGMILHCGPTGSGKSMTLYAALNEINSPELKILTAEDPIEYTLPRIVQVQMKRAIGLTFASTLRSFLRQDPDIILVGEIRDLETAEIAIEAALTGHLLFSTLHTNDAVSTVTRLTDIGIEPFLISSTLLAVCAQRLMRRLCSCRASVPLAGMQAAFQSIPHTELLARAHTRPLPEQICEARGCPECGNSGYKGRVGIHELMAMNDPLRAAISSGAHEAEIKRLARANGMYTLFEDAMEKVVDGTSSMKEALTTVLPDEDRAPAQ